jgi:hypothetical protein
MMRNLLILSVLLGLSIVLMASATDTYTVNLYSANTWGKLKYLNLNIKKDIPTMSSLQDYSETVSGTLSSFDANKTIMGAFGYDINTDGNTDLITVDADGYMRIFENIKNTDTNKFGQKFLETSNERIFPITKNGYGAGTIGDFDGDDELDLFYINNKRAAAFVSNIFSANPIVNESNSYTVSLGSNYNSGTWDSQSMTTLNLDYETDDFPEIIYITRGGYVYALNNSEDSERVFFQNGSDFPNGNATLLFQSDELSGGSSHAGVIDYGDFNADTVPDLVCGNSNRMGIYLYLGYKDETTKRIKFDTDNRITLIDQNGRLNEKIDNRDYSSGGENYFYEPVEFDGSNSRPFAPTVLRIDENVSPSLEEPLPDIVIGTDKFRSNDNYGRIVYAINNVKIDQETNEILSASVTVLNPGGEQKDLDSGTLGDINGDGYTDVVFTDGNQSEDFAIYKSLVNDYYCNYVNFLSKTLDVIDSGYRERIENGIFTKSATVTIDIPSGIPGTFYCELLQGPPKRTDVLDLKKKYDDGSISVQVNSLQNGEQTLVMYFEFAKPRPQPQLFFEFYAVDQNPLSPLLIGDIDIELGLSDEISLVISNISWQKSDQ